MSSSTLEPMDWEESPAHFLAQSDSTTFSSTKLLEEESHPDCECESMAISGKKEEEEPLEDCVICLTNLAEPAEDEVTFPSNRLKVISTTDCKHRFHKVCLDRWIKEKKKKAGAVVTCPVCRGRIGGPAIWTNPNAEGRLSAIIRIRTIVRTISTNQSTPPT